MDHHLISVTVTLPEVVVIWDENSRPQIDPLDWMISNRPCSGPWNIEVLLPVNFLPRRHQANHPWWRLGFLCLFFCFEGFRWVLFSRFFWLFLLSCHVFLICLLLWGMDGMNWWKSWEPEQGECLFFKGDPGFSWTMILEFHLRWEGNEHVGIYICIYIHYIDIFYWIFCPTSKISILSQTNNLSSKSHLCWVEWSKDINQIFDILPIMGTLEPGHTQESVICRCLVGSMLAEGLIEVDSIYPYSPSTYACFQTKWLPNLFWKFQNLEKECWIHGDMPRSMLGLEEITFTYYGMRNQKFDVAAVCQTEGGPEQLRFSSGKPRCGVIFFKHIFWSVFELKLLFLATKMCL